LKICLKILFLNLVSKCPTVNLDLRIEALFQLSVQINKDRDLV